MQGRAGALSQLRRGHEELVLGLLRRHGPLSRGDLGTRSGLSRTTLHDILAALTGKGAVVTTTRTDGPRGRGRPAETLALNPDAGQAIGIDFARRAVHVAIVNVAHEVVGSTTEAHPADLPFADRVELAERLVGTLVEGSLRLGALDAVGAGVVGPVVDPGDHAEVSRLLRKRFGVPVLLDNNTRLAALAESIWGAAAGQADVLYLRLSHGVGGGLVVGGTLHRTVASIRAVLDAYGHARDVPELVAALDNRDPAALAVLRSVGTRIGTVLAAVCNAVGPGMIVIGGELAEAGSALFGPIETAVSANIMPISRHRVSLHRATLGDIGGALGGIALVLHESPLLSRYPAEPEPGEE
jgi:predicted NBD/HSP70 family sugar kinase